MAPVLDPVCGMEVRTGRPLIAEYDGHPFHFCSSVCQEEFLTQPQVYATEPFVSACANQGRTGGPAWAERSTAP